MADELARSLTDYIAIPVGRSLAKSISGIQPIRFYSYRAGYAPNQDAFELKENSFDAIGVDAEGFHTFGLGIQLEMSPNALPRYSFCWYVRAKVDDERWTCQVGVGNQELIYLIPPVNIDDLRPIVKLTYEELLNWLKMSSNGVPKQSKFGFSQD